MSQDLLQINEMTVAAAEKVLVNQIDLKVPALSITALVGASGSGKTTVALSILRLLPPALNIRKGSIFFEGVDILKSSEEHMRQIRGGGVGMVFQEPLDAFNPVFTIGYQIEEVLLFHTGLGRRERQKRALELLALTGLPEPARAAGSYTHQLSGGMRQRAMIAQAVAANPRLIIADEPTSNLDVTMQARIMDLFKKLNEELKISILLITHDLSMAMHLADHAAVMEKGCIVEDGVAAEVFRNPRHRYTQELMEALST